MAGFDFLLGGPDANSDQANAQRMGLLAAGLGMLANNTGHYGAAGPAIAGGGLAGLQGYQGALDQQAQNRANAFKLQQQQAQMDAARAKQAYVQGIATGQRQFNPNEALAAGMSLDEIKGMADFGNFGRQKVKDYREIRLPDGRVVSQGFDEYGQPVGEGQTPFKAPQFQDLGGRVVSIDPLTGKIGGEFGKSMTPGEIASNSIARANLGISQQRLAMEKDAPKGQIVQTEQGVMIVDPRTGLARPAVDLSGNPMQGKGAAPTEFQGKSAVFGARASEADKILSGLQGKYSPAGIGAKQSAGNVPIVGGILGAIGNTALSPESQMAEQAQRDFVNATLRQESGASIAPAEFDNARKQYFPQPGDSQAVIAQKARNRAITIQGLNNNAGKAAYTPAQPKAAGNGGWSAKRID